METLELTSSSILALFETNKDQRASFVNQLVHEMEEGLVDPLKVKLQLKCIEDVIEMLTNRDPKKNKNAQAAVRFNDLVLDAASKYGKEFQVHNAEFSIRETGVKYDFSLCGDIQLDRILPEYDRISGIVTSRKDFLKSIPSEGIEMIDPEDGEVYRAFPPSKTSTTSIAVKLK